MHKPVTPTLANIVSGDMWGPGDGRNGEKWVQ